MRAYYCHHFVLPLPEHHRFPMAKYRRLHERVAAHADALGIELHEPAPASIAALARAHDREYIRRVVDASSRPRSCAGSAFRGRPAWWNARAARPAERWRRSRPRSPATASR